MCASPWRAAPEEVGHGSVQPAVGGYRYQIGMSWGRGEVAQAGVRSPSPRCLTALPPSGQTAAFDLSQCPKFCSTPNPSHQYLGLSGDDEQMITASSEQLLPRQFSVH